MRFLEALNSDYAFLVLGSVMAFTMAVLRCLRFEHRDKSMMFIEAGMCTMITLSVSIGAKTTWDIPYNWSIPVGVFIGFIGTSFIHMLIKRFIMTVTNYYTGEGAKPNLPLPEPKLRRTTKETGDDRIN